MRNSLSQLHTLIEEGKNVEAITMIKSIEPYILFHRDRFLLHRAVEHDNVAIAEYLIDHGWDLNAENADGKSTLEIAWKRNKADMISMLNRQLLDAMENNSLIDQSIELTKPRWPNDLKQIEKLLRDMTRGCFGNKLIAGKLLQLNCSLAAAMCAFRNTELTKLMLKGGCPIDGRLISTGETALHLAVEHSDVDHVKLLLDFGAKVDATDSNGSTPISRIKVHESVEILKSLLDHGASPTVTLSRRRSSQWQSHDPRRTVIDEILRDGDMRMLRLIIPYVDLSHKDENGCTPLHHLVNNGKLCSLELLRGKCIDANQPDNNVWTPRDIAVSRAMYEKVRFLLEHGASPNNSGHDGDVAIRWLLLDVSKYKEAVNVLELLLLYDADLELLTRSYYTTMALDHAMKKRLDFSKMVLADLAKSETLDTFFTETIKSDEHLQNYFDTCKRQIEEMKVTSLYESITLYKLLTDSQRRLTLYARNEEFQLHYESFKNKDYSIHSYYFKKITSRVDRAMALAKIKNKVASIICRITGLPTSVVDIAYIIVDYLNRNDLQNIIAI